MITQDQITALAKAGLADVCEFNEDFLHGDGTPLTDDEADTVAGIMAEPVPKKKSKK